MLIYQPLTLFVEIVLLAIALALLIPISVLFIECSAALFPRRRVTELSVTVPRPRISILVPAHNEAAGIGATLETLLPQLTAQDRLVVIADNCDDETTAIARKLEVTVIERYEPDRSRRGKGYALDYGLEFIAADPPEVVVTVDGDCIAHAGMVDKIARQAFALTRPVQATYLMNQPDNPRLNDSLSTLAVTFKNLVRPSGLDRLGLPCLLTGSGMAFPWSVIRKVSLASSKTVDDMQLALDLAVAGHAPKYSQAAQVMGRLMTQQAAKSQRARWEHGHLETLLTQVPYLLQESVRQKRFDLFATALDLCVPPLSLLVMIWTAAMSLSLAAGLLGFSWSSAVLLGAEGLLIFMAIIGAWVKFGRSDLPLLTLLVVPLYVLWKIPLYLAFLVQPQTKWVRTERDSVNAPEA